LAKKGNSEETDWGLGKVVTWNELRGLGRVGLRVKQGHRPNLKGRRGQKKKQIG